MSRTEEIRTLLGELRREFGDFTQAAPLIAPEPLTKGDADATAEITKTILKDFKPDTRGKELDLELALRDQTYFDENKAELNRLMARINEAKREAALDEIREASMKAMIRRDEERTAAEATAKEAERLRVEAERVERDAFIKKVQGR